MWRAWALRYRKCDVSCPRMNSLCVKGTSYCIRRSVTCLSQKAILTSHIVLLTETGCTGTGISFNLHAAWTPFPLNNQVTRRFISVTSDEEECRAHAAWWYANAQVTDFKLGFLPLSSNTSVIFRLKSSCNLPNTRSQSRFLFLVKETNQHHLCINN